ncbi:AAA family ATPase [Salinibacter altiplanensis]|uniref:AAA family ATPase n=1 Tax=Salinibacter altiplanensis TaxID=1803181 RepID=UPI000C9EF04D|nr:AAA family ATPase [Salinibacter altiplanensis]
MRLLRLRPYYFRCYGESDWIELDADLVILYGSNGFGKTSLVESIEWLFHGRAKRRKRGVEVYSKRDYRNYYRNVHAPEDAPTFVEAEVETADENRHKIRRELDNPNKNDTSNTTVIDGSEKPFSTIGLNEDPAFDPVIPQHSLQDFILSRPIDRRDKISAALGLDPLIEFDRTLDSTNRRLQRTPPNRVEQAREGLQSAIRKMDESEDDKVIALLKKWREQEFDLSEDEEKLLQAAQDLLGTQETNRITLSEELTTHREKVADRVFDPTPIRPPSNRENLREAIQESKQEILESELKQCEDALSSYLGVAAAEYASECLSFWKTGLQLRDEDTDTCPMCEAPTLDKEKREEIRERLEKTSEFTSAKKTLQDSVSDFSQRLRRISRRIDGLFPGFLTSPNRESLADLIDDRGLLQPFLTCHDASELSIIKTRDALSDLADSIDEIPELASDPESVREAKERLLKSEKRIEHAIGSICSTAESYAEAYENLEEKLEEVIASDDAVKQIDALMEPLDKWESAEVLAEYHGLMDEVREAGQRLSDHLQDKQEEKLEDRGKEIKDWYGVMNPASNVVPSRLDAGAESLRIYAEAFDSELNVATGLSQCQANTLGLSIHFMRTLSPGSPYRFIVLDDPVQSMDDKHFEALSRDVIERLLDQENLQVIVGTHTRALSDKLWSLHIDQRSKYLRISDISREGPTISKEKTFEDELERIEHLAKGNEEDREIALDRIRNSTEHLIGLICRVEGHPLLDPNEHRTAKQKLYHLSECPSVKAKYISTLKDTIEFSNSAHHESEGESVPEEGKIQTHLSTLHSYGDMFEVLEKR